MPIQRLDEKPDRTATLQDITCDSDGKVANFISTKNVSHYLPVHSLKSKEPYYVGVFLVGAYQEILGDMHNLFGDTNAVHVSVSDKGYTIEQVIDGETVAEVLDYVQYSPKKLVRTLETWVNPVGKRRTHIFGRRKGNFCLTIAPACTDIHIWNNERETDSN